MHDKSKANIYAVAERAGVSVSTVSRVLNGSNLVSPPTRARVRDAMEELRYRPSRTARSLAQQRKRTLALAIPSFTTPFHNELLKGTRNRLRDEDIDLLFCDLGSHRVTQALLSFLRRGSVDALLLVGVEESEMLTRELKTLQAPVVQVGWKWKAFDSFYWDHVAGAKTAVDHLVLQGHRRIGLLTSHVTSTLQEERIEGYRQALETAGIPFDPSLVQSGSVDKHAGFSEETGYQAMKQLLALEPAVTAVFASSDVQAIGAWKAIREAGKSVPGDVALVGYDDIKMSAYLGLTSVDQAMQDVGHRAAHRLIEQMIDPVGELLSVMITPRLKVRESSRNPGDPEAAALPLHPCRTAVEPAKADRPNAPLAKRPSGS